MIPQLPTRLMTVAALTLASVTLAACGEADNKKPSPQPDTTPNGGITAQPDTNGTDTTTDGRGESPGDSMNGGTNETGGAVPGDGDMSVGGGKDARSRKYDRALAASLSQLILNRIGD